MWPVEVMVRQRVERALREGEQERLGKAARSARKKRTLNSGPIVSSSVWFRSLFRAEEQDSKPSSATAKAA